MIEREMLLLLKEGNWPALWAYSREKDPISITDSGLRALLEGILWKNPQAVSSIAKKVAPRAMNAAEIFLLEAARLSVGDGANTNRTLSRLKNLNAPRWMHDWLAIESYGRRREYARQAKLITNATSALRSTLSVPALTSLSHPNVDPGPLLNHFKEHPPETLNLELLFIAMKRLRLPACDVMEHIDQVIAKYGEHPSIELRRSEVLLRGLGKPKDALISLDKAAVAGWADSNDMNTWLELSLSHPSGMQFLPMRVKHAIQQTPPESRTQSALATYAIIWFWLEGRRDEAKQVLANHLPFAGYPANSQDKNNQIYFRYLSYLLAQSEVNVQLYQTAAEGELYVVGESHSLGLANLVIPWQGRSVRGKSRIVMGLKMHHLASPSPITAYRKAHVKAHLDSLPNRVDLLLTVGEIDCRPDEGIIAAATKMKRTLDDVLEQTTTGYINFLREAVDKSKYRSVTVQGIPAPGYLMEGTDPIDIANDLLDVIKQTNQLLKQMAHLQGWGFLDTYHATKEESVFGKSRWHLDTHHLKPAFYAQAEKYLSLP